MELSGGNGNGSEYTSVAFGQTARMENADLYYCTGPDFESGVITELHYPPTKLDIDAEPGIGTISKATNNGVAQCVFSRAASITKNITTGPKDFDLSADTYYILVAGGAVESGNLDYHFGNRRISDNRMNLTVLRTTETTMPDMTSSHAPAETTMPDVTSTHAPAETTPGKTSTCEIKDRCIDMPKDCSPASPDCLQFTWSYDKESETFDMHISGGSVGDGKSYAGVAFGRVDRMENNDLYYCTGESLESGAITTLHEPPMHLNISEETGITNIVAQATNGVSKCSFVRASSIKKPITGERMQDYDLTDGKYYILLAKGDVDEDGMLHYHFESRFITDEAVQIGSGAAVVLNYWIVLLSACLLAVNFRSNA